MNIDTFHDFLYSFQSNEKSIEQVIDGSPLDVLFRLHFLLKANKNRGQLCNDAATQKLAEYVLLQLEHYHDFRTNLYGRFLRPCFDTLAETMGVLLWRDVEYGTLKFDLQVAYSVRKKGPLFHFKHQADFDNGLCYSTAKFGRHGVWCSLVDVKESHYGKTGVEIPQNEVGDFANFCYLYSVQYPKKEVAHIYVILEHKVERSGKLVAVEGLEDGRYETHNLFIRQDLVDSVQLDELKRITRPHKLCVKQKRVPDFVCDELT
mmetsp:Transcript_8043/g.13893  ORF Transcript_8043/g.13893 Transcript_8043/m.13893 type:complete len:262 (-) Transcript_8043:50-835(-)|eukprot:CAMPEP_0168580780 /NCGR_PEP_ID=MMETSP0420-20121227/1005_1 /TAXON_ID=498008 /ORGANISM="Pessonella sp." /LENGTH=261 /DNA_ID=CAMNT_0008614971 /DNA_START=265 /DNA_END=1050 /DNA_ORIENTATION=+